MSTVCTFQKSIQNFLKKWEGQVIMVFVSVVIFSEHPVCTGSIRNVAKTTNANIMYFMNKSDYSFGLSY